MNGAVERDNRWMDLSHSQCSSGSIRFGSVRSEQMRCLFKILCACVYAADRWIIGEASTRFRRVDSIGQGEGSLLTCLLVYGNYAHVFKISRGLNSAAVCERL